MLHYKIYPNTQSNEWITFVHGAGGSSAIWSKQIKAFKKHYNLLLLDLRGHGRSKHIVYNEMKKYTFNVIGNDVVEVLDSLKIKKSHFVGISLGTVVIRDIAER